MTELTAFCCAECGVDVSDFLRPNSHTVVFGAFGESENSTIPLGHYVRVATPWTYRDFITGRQKQVDYVSEDGASIVFESGDYLLNPRDARHRMALRASYGCCGFDPRNELNALCRNGHLIGTIHSDCRTSTVFRLSAMRIRTVTVGGL